MNKTINDLAKSIHAQNVEAGWWDGDGCIFEKLQLVSTEIAEATEGERKDLMDDHLPQRKMGEVELADALIRLLDIAGRYGWTFNFDTQPRRSIHMANSIAGKHLMLNASLIAICDMILLNEAPIFVAKFYSQMVAGILYVGNCKDYDIMGALHEKVEYNKTRQDHKRENRAKPGGKKF